MNCPKCKVELRVHSSKYVMEGQDLYLIKEMACRNPNCENFDNVVDTIKIKLSYETEDES